MQTQAEFCLYLTKTTTELFLWGTKPCMNTKSIKMIISISIILEIISIPLSTQKLQDL